MNLHEHIAYCTEQQQILERICSTADALLSEDPTTSVISGQPGKSLQYESGQVTPISLQLTDEGVQDIADDMEQLEDIARDLNETLLGEAGREFNKGRELVTAVSAALRRMRGEEVSEDGSGIPTAYKFGHMRFRETNQRVGDYSAVIGQLAFSHVEHEQEATIWRIQADVGPQGVECQLVYLRDQPVLAQWNPPLRDHQMFVHRFDGLGLPERVLDLLSHRYNEREDVDRILQEAYFATVGQPQEEKAGEFLQDIRAYVMYKRRELTTKLSDISAPTPDQLRSISVQLNALHNG